MVYQSLDLVGTVHCHGVQEKHLFVKGWHGPNFLQTQKQIQLQHEMCLVVEIRGWQNPIEAHDHLVHLVYLIDPNYQWSWWNHRDDMIYPHPEVGYQVRDNCHEVNLLPKKKMVWV